MDFSILTSGQILARSREKINMKKTVKGGLLSFLKFFTMKPLTEQLIFRFISILESVKGKPHMRPHPNSCKVHDVINPRIYVLIRGRSVCLTEKRCVCPKFHQNLIKMFGSAEGNI